MIRFLAIAALMIQVACFAQLPTDFYTATQGEVIDGLNAEKPVTPLGLSYWWMNFGSTNGAAGGGITNNQTGVTLTGAFTGNGSGLTNLNAAALTGGPITNTINTGGATFGGEVDDISTVSGGYYQHFIQNLSPTGSGDLVLGNDLATTTGSNNYVDLGINGSQYVGTWGKTNDGYLYVVGGNFTFGVNDTNRIIGFSVGNGGASNNAWIDTNGMNAYEFYRQSVQPFDANEAITPGAFQPTNLPAGTVTYAGGWLWYGTNRSWTGITYDPVLGLQTNTVYVDDDSMHTRTNDNRVLNFSNITSTIALSNLFASGFITTHTNQIGANMLTNAMIAGLIGSNQVCIIQTNNTSPGEMQFLSVNSATNIVNANIRVGTITGSLSGTMNGGNLNGNLIGISSTVGSLACTNVTATNAIVQRAIYIGSTNISGIPLAFTNGPQLSNAVVIYGSGAAGGSMTAYFGYFNVQSNLTTANITANNLSGSQFLSFGTTAGQMQFAGTNAAFTNVVANTYWINTNMLALSTNFDIPDWRYTNTPFLWASNNTTGLTVFLRQWVTSILTPVNLDAGNLVATNISSSGNITATGQHIGNGGGLTNVPAAGIVNTLLTWTGPTNSVSVTNASSWFYVAAANCSITNVFGGAAGLKYGVDFTISNSTGGAITSYWTAAGYAAGLITTNALTIPAGKEGYYTIEVRNGNRTNYMNCLQQ